MRTYENNTFDIKKQKRNNTFLDDLNIIIRSIRGFSRNGKTTCGVSLKYCTEECAKYITKMLEQFGYQVRVKRYKNNVVFVVCWELKFDNEGEISCEMFNANSASKLTYENLIGEIETLIENAIKNDEKELIYEIYHCDYANSSNIHQAILHYCDEKKYKFQYRDDSYDHRKIRITW